MASIKQHRRQTSWRNWFAWYPVKVRGSRVWLKTVQRKGDFYWRGSAPKRLRWLYRYRDEGVL